MVLTPGLYGLPEARAVARESLRLLSPMNDLTRNDSPAAELQTLIHDLRNPVNVIAMNVELLTLEHDGTDDAGSLAALRRAVVELEQRLIALEGCSEKLPASEPPATQ